MSVSFSWSKSEREGRALTLDPGRSLSPRRCRLSRLSTSLRTCPEFQLCFMSPLQVSVGPDPFRICQLASGQMLLLP